MRPVRAHHRTAYAGLALALALSTAPAAPAGPATDAQPSQPESVVVIYRDDTITASDFTALSAAGVAPDSVTVRRPDVAVVDVVPGTSARTLAKRLRAQPGVAAAARVGQVQVAETVPPNDYRYSHELAGGTFFVDQQTYLGPNASDPYSMDLEPVWEAVFNSDTYAAEPDRAGVTIAIIDTGVTPAIMEDNGRIVPAWNYVAGNTDTRDDYRPAYHGTRVASLMAAQANNAYGIAGTLHSTKSRILIYKSLDAYGYGTSDDTMIAMMDAADAGAKIINASLGEPAVMDWPAFDSDSTFDFSPDTELRAAWQATVDYCVNKGAIVVAATGNSAADTWYGDVRYTDVIFPAACDGVLAVGSINPTTGVRSSFSSYGPQVDVMAAGEKVWTVHPLGDASSVPYGTSFAAPLISGAIATLWSLVPDMPAERMTEFVRSSADSSTALPGFDNETGYGRFDAWSAYQSMIASVAVQPQVALTASAPSGFETTLSWAAAQGTGVHYRYGFTGGPSYLTTATAGRLMLPSDGTHDVYVRAYANDRFDSLEATTTTVTVNTGMGPLSSARHQGDDRYETAAAISRAAYPGTAPAVVIASGQNWPDGLAASVLARTAGGPLLLTRRPSLPVATRDEILRLKPSTIYIVGGTGAVTGTVEETIRSLRGVAFTVERIGGVDRYETAAMIASRVAALGGAADGTAIVASGQNYPDALSGAPLAAMWGAPILLTKSGTVPAATRTALAGVERTLVLGGTKVIDAAVFASLPDPLRLFGADRYATSRAIAEYATGPDGSDGSALGFATGQAFPDALSAGPLLALRGAPLVLTDGMTPGLESWLEQRDGQVESLSLFGGTAALPYELEFDLKGALRNPGK